MKYHIELAATAKADIRQQALWLRGEASPAIADRWLAGLYEAIDTLQTHPGRCSIAAESRKFPEELRQLLYGRRKKHHRRIIFTIREDTVYVLYVRHGHRDELEP
jgi:plasmid stabilization system protein ParE